MSAWRAAGVVLIVAWAASGCTSPESTRMRAGGGGADVGNRRPIVEMHEGSKPYWQTPNRVVKGVGMDDSSGSALPRSGTR